MTKRFMPLMLLAVLLALASCSASSEAVFNTERRMLSDAIASAELSLEEGQHSDVIEAAKKILNDADSDYSDIMDAVSSLSMFQYSDTSPKTIVFIDHAFEQRVKKQLGVTELTVDRAATVTALDLSYDPEDSDGFGRIVYTEDFKWFPNLTSVNLANNAVRDLSGIAHLTNLTELDLSGNFSDIISLNSSFIDFSVLSSLKNLKVLNLADNGIKSITTLKNLTSLVELDLSGNAFGSLSSLSGLTELNRLVLDNASVSDISALYSLDKIEYLSMCNSTLSSKCDISNMTHLKELYLSGAKGVDTIELSSLTSLETLDVSGIGLKKISFASKLDSLKSINVSNNKISDISALLDLPALQYLDASSNAIKTVEIGSTTLISLNLSDNLIKTITFSSYNTTLKYLDISQNSVKELNTTRLTGLTELDASSNSIKDVTDITSPVLEKLNLYDNSFTVYDAVNPKLKWLSLRNNTVKKISGVFESPLLETLNIADTYVYTFDSLLELKNLKDLTIDVQYAKDLYQVSLFTNIDSLTVYGFYGNYWDIFDSLKNTLTSLTLKSDQITAPQLSGFTKLKELSFIDCTTLSDLSQITDMPALERLYVRNADTSEPNITGLVALRTLELVNCNVQDVSFIYDLPLLETLNLSENILTTFVFSSFPHLSTLNLSSNGLRYLEGFSVLLDGGSLYLSDNRLESLDDLSVLTSLKLLDISGNSKVSKANIPSTLSVETVIE